MKNNLPQKTAAPTVSSGQAKIIHKPNQPGKWVYKPTRSAVLVCSCGNKYIATRKDQTTCVSCIRTLAQK